MPDKRQWRLGLVIGLGLLLVFMLLSVAAGAAGSGGTEPVAVEHHGVLAKAGMAMSSAWTEPEQISTNTPPAEKVDAIDLAVGGDNNLHAVWVERVEAGTLQFNIYHASATPSGNGEWSWSSPDSVISDQYSPASLVVDSSNRIHVTYPNKDKSSIRYSRGTKSGSTWSWTHGILNSPPNFATTQAGTAGWPVIAVSGSTLHVVWTEIGDDPPYNQHFQIVHGASQDWGSTWPQALTTEVYSSTKMSQYPDMVVGQDGKLHVVWEEGASTSAVIYYTYGTPSGGTVTWAEPVTVSGAMTDCHRPSIAIANNTLYVAWGQTVGDKTNQDVYYSTKSASGGSWSTPTKLSVGHVALGNTAPTYVSPRILATNEGRVVIVWDGYVSAEQNGKEDVYCSETDDIGDSGAWTGRVNISANVGASYGPAVAMSENNILHAIWIDEFRVFYSHSQYGVFLPLIMKNW